MAAGSLSFVVAKSRNSAVLHHIGLGLQLLALTFLPLVVLWQLNFGIPLLVMPISLLVGMGVFHIGTRMRETK